MGHETAFYHVGRALYEAADHFGKSMNLNHKPVYHGLDRKMNFCSFTEYFNAPMSTTEDLSVGMLLSFEVPGSYRLIRPNFARKYME